jgi:hypothetical protein
MKVRVLLQEPLINSKTIGDISVLKIATALLQKDVRVLFPFGDNARYDLAIDDGKIHRIQCKTAHANARSVTIPSVSSYHHRHGGFRHYLDDVEFLAAYCVENDKCYLVPIDKVGGGQSMRLSLTEDGRGLLLALDYEIRQPLSIVFANRSRRVSLIEIGERASAADNVKTALKLAGLTDTRTGRDRLRKALFKYGRRKLNRKLLKSFGLGPKGVKMKIKWPSSSTIKRKVWQEPSTHLARRLGVSDRALTKHCVRNGIPKPPRGYWAKQQIFRVSNGGEGG